MKHLFGWQVYKTQIVGIYISAR